MNLNAATAAAFILAGLALSAAPAGAAPAPNGPGDWSADSPTSVTFPNPGTANISDANGIATVVHWKDANHSTTVGAPHKCQTSWTGVHPEYGYDIGEKFQVIDCQGFKKTFYFPKVG
jgi:hypothetical protein